MCPFVITMDLVKLHPRVKNKESWLFAARTLNWARASVSKFCLSSQDGSVNLPRPIGFRSTLLTLAEKLSGKTLRTFPVTISEIFGECELSHSKGTGPSPMVRSSEINFSSFGCRY
jgi:hypothetical protein